jgi:hypothetical protein
LSFAVGIEGKEGSPRLNPARVSLSLCFVNHPAAIDPQCLLATLLKP